MRAFLVFAVMWWTLASGCSQARSSKAAWEERRAELFAGDAMLQRFIEKRRAIEKQRKSIKKIYGEEFSGVRAIDQELIVCDRFIETRQRQLEAELGFRPAKETATSD